MSNIENQINESKKNSELLKEFMKLRKEVLGDESNQKELKEKVLEMTVESLNELRQIKNMTEKQNTIIIEKFVVKNNSELYKEFAEKLFKDLKERGIYQDNNSIIIEFLNKELDKFFNKFSINESKVIKNDKYYENIGEYLKAKDEFEKSKEEISDKILESSIKMKEAMDKFNKNIKN